jgi:hypothetical protein
VQVKLAQATGDGDELPVRAYTLGALVHCATCEGGGGGLTATDTVSQMAGAAMQYVGATPATAE